MLGEIKEKSATAILQNLVDDLSTGNAAREEQLDIYLAASKNGGFEDTLQTLQQQARRDAQTPSEFLPVAFLMYGGNASKGQQVFLQHPAAQCIRCHAVGQGEGSTVGPNLADIGNKVDRAYLVEALIEPSAKLAEGFDNAAAVSVMPPMGGLLTPEELRDVVAYLASLKD